MPHVMPLRDSRARAERVFILRAIEGRPWSFIRDAERFGSVGSAQMAYRRFLTRNPVPDGKTALAEIIARKRFATGTALRAMAEAQAAGDHQMVATLMAAVTRDDAELAKLFGLNAPERAEVDLRVSTEDNRKRLLALAETKAGALAAQALPALPVIDAETAEVSA
jgi:hypothetical protein